MTAFRFATILGLLCLCLPAALRAQSEFDPGGYNSMRIENEIKLVVPREQQDAVWDYLQSRYAPGSPFLASLDSAFHAKFAMDKFIDQYFDDPEWSLVKLQSGVRHRRREVLTDKEDRKDGRELMQIKINDINNNQLSRGEYKYPIKHYKPGGNEEKYDDHPFLGLVKRKHRPAVLERLKEIQLDGEALAPTIKIVQLRKRAYILRDTMPFATLTLDIDSAYYLGDAIAFTEMEMELNEIAYTESDSAGRLAMEAINDKLRADLLAQLPDIHQDQTPKYNKAAAAFGIDPANGKFGKWHMTAAMWRNLGLIAGLLVVVGGIVLLYLRRARGHARERAAYLAKAGKAQS